MPKKLSPRRQGITDTIIYVDEKANEWKLLITCNVDEKDRVREVFCANPMKGADLDALLIDGCILISLLLQSDVATERIAGILSERRPERGTGGPPASMLGAIARLVHKIDTELQDETGA